MWNPLCDGLEDEFQKGTTPLRRNGEPPIKRSRRDYNEKIEEEEENDEPFKWFHRQREVCSYSFSLFVRCIVMTCRHWKKLIELVEEQEYSQKRTRKLGMVSNLDGIEYICIIQGLGDIW